ncbi:MAG: DNA starvation/stationary phase protection protein [Bacteroidales bacterium]|nr:DNA starvation/stationary phase protection protein [Bacteroidales bacterium]
MSTKNRIGLDKTYAETVSKELNELLANVQILYSNVRGFHWKIKGQQFFMLHEKFEELYLQLAEVADQIAERILMLEEKPVHNFSEYLKLSKIAETGDISSGEETVKLVLKSYHTLMQKEKAILEQASVAGDEGTVGLMAELMNTQEKQVWMYSAFQGQ